ncbi:MAG TPA: sigma-70 family RNA polymerase sigma factor [Lachnospiraceae bacterium]|nr:sigma-70 family RNA polymerase sigma factor [Lachnospiraceae bacterium]
MPDFNHTYIGSLVTRSQANDSDAFAELYALTYRHIYNYAGHYLRDSFLAQDAVQETYISALKNIASIKDPSLFIAWLNQICFHICFDICKKNNQCYGSTDSELIEIIRDERIDHNPEDKFEKKAETESIQKAIRLLPFNEQQVIVMRYYNEMKLEEIASALQCSRSSVKRYLTHGRDRLEEMLRKEES